MISPTRMSFRSVFVISFALLLSPALWAAEGRCVQGRGEVQKQVGDYVVQIGATEAAEHAGECRAAVSSSAGRIVFETFGYEAVLVPASGKDINGDGVPDVVLETRSAPGQCCATYSIVSLGDPPGLLRQITTSAELAFEDRGGDGRVEIWTRETAFDGFDGLGHSDSPFPLVVFRLKGNTLFNVSATYWPEYEREITQARASLSRSALDAHMGIQSASTAGVSGGGNKPKELSPREIQQINEARGLVLQIVLSYLYGGRGQEAWKQLAENWPYADRERIRQLILKTRTTGVLSEVNRPAPQAKPK